MTIEILPLSPALGVELGGVDPKHLEASDRSGLRDVFLEHGVLLIRDLDLSPRDHVDFTRVFGEPEIHPIPKVRLAGQPEVIALAGGPGTTPPAEVPKPNQVIGRIDWHSDLTYTPLPSRGALLYARVVPPEGGQTGWIDTAAVYDALPESTRQKLEGLMVFHSLAKVQQAIDDAKTGEYEGGPDNTPEFPPAEHPIVHRHPETGRRALNVCPAFAQRIVGLPDDEADALLRELQEFATQDRFVYFHDWRVGDLVVWDNWRTMHLATGHPRRFERLMHRTTLRGGERLVA